MQMDWVDILLRGVPILLSLGAIVYAAFATRRGDVDRRFREQQATLIDHDRRIQRVEDTRLTLATTDQVNGIQVTLAQIGGDLGAIRTRMQAQTETLQRIERRTDRHEDHLMGRDRD